MRLPTDKLIDPESLSQQDYSLACQQCCINILVRLGQVGIVRPVSITSKAFDRIVLAHDPLLVAELAAIGKISTFLVGNHRPFGDEFKTALYSYRISQGRLSPQAVIHLTPWGTKAIEVDLDPANPHFLMRLPGHVAQWIAERITGKRQNPWWVRRRLKAVCGIDVPLAEGA